MGGRDFRRHVPFAQGDMSASGVPVTPGLALSRHGRVGRVHIASLYALRCCIWLVTILV
jgi:hypothetical protein